MILTETIPANFCGNRIAQIQRETEHLNVIATELKTQYKKLTQLFARVGSALEIVSQLNALVPQTSTKDFLHNFSNLIPSD